jgi:hypothetical protein
MATAAAPFTETWHLAAAAFAEGCGCLGDAATLSKDEARPSVAYGFQVLTSGLVQVEALARRYVTAPECTYDGAAKPILNDPMFRSAALRCATAIDEALPHLGLPGKRIAEAVRRWVDSSNPADARTVAMACDATARITKTKAGRAA